MLKIKILIIIFCCIGVVKAQTVIPPSSETPPGWIYYDGDEFNGDVIDSQYWGIYGSPKVGRPTYNQENKAMLQTYRPEQVFIETLPTGEKICRIRSFKSKDAPSPVHPSVKSKTGWWSGALSSRDSDTEKYYPLFCRIEIKAKVPYLYGLWNALWLRHYKGAGVAEIDILEFFTKAFGENPYPSKANQTLHLFNSETQKLGINLPKGQIRYTEIGDDKPGDNFHVYAVQIDPDPVDNNHAIITFLIDNKVNYQIHTRTQLGDAYTDFITKARKEDRLDRVWDIAITGQVGAFDKLDVGYPAEELQQFDFDIDWIRVYVRDPHTRIVGNSKLPHTPEADSFVKDLLSRMTVEEKIGQLSQYVGRTLLTGPESEYLSDSLIARGLVGSVLNISGAKTLRDLQEKNMRHSRIKIPILFGMDVIHGYKTIFPTPLAESCSWDLAAIERAAKIAAIESSAAGLHWTFAPMVDIARDARWGRVVEGAGEDTYLGSEIAKARVNGFQWNLWENNSVLACAKHWVAYGLPQAGRDYAPVDMSERTLFDTYLPPFKACIDAGVLTFMSAFNDINGIPASAHPFLLKDLLRGQWNFNGFVVSDWEAVKQLVAQGVAEDDKDATRLAFNSGIDMDMTDGLYNKYMKELIEAGKISMEDVDNSVSRILHIKYALGLFVDPYKFCNEEYESQTIMKKEFLDAALDMAHKSAVLLKNDNHTLPLAKNVRSIAVVGPLADNQTELLGSWRARGEDRHVTTVLQGIKNKIGGNKTKVGYARGCDFDGEDKSGFKEAVKLASKSDMVIAVVGEKALMSGESRSRAQLDLPGVQEELIKELVATGKPVVVVLMNGRPLSIEWVDKNVSAILETWFLGTSAGTAIADILFGDYNPSGRLTISFPRVEGQVPIYYNYKKSGRPGDMLHSSTTRHIDVPNAPLYPFGYGLSYTTFSYSAPQSTQKEYTRQETISVSVTVTNTGDRDGEETVQLYVNDKVASVVRPVKELKAFKKIFLKAGESKTVQFDISPLALGFYDAAMNYVVEPGEFEIMTGCNSNDLQTISVKLIN